MTFAEIYNQFCHFLEKEVEQEFFEEKIEERKKKLTILFPKVI